MRAWLRQFRYMREPAENTIGSIDPSNILVDSSGEKVRIPYPVDPSDDADFLHVNLITFGQ